MPTPIAQPLEARLFLAAASDASGRFMFMPAGTHAIHCTRAGKPVSVNVAVNAKTADALNAQLAAVSRAKAPQKPYCDFNHDKDKASFWPERFAWQPDGVYVEGKFSASGKAAIEGQDYRGFSPTFFVDDIAANPAQVICNEAAGLNFGGLVNEPAFNQISPLWAKSAGVPGDAENPNNQDDMKKTIAELQAAKATLETQVKALEAKATRNEVESAQLEARKAELHGAEQDLKIAELEARDVERRTKDADEAVSRAVKRGALPAQDTALQAKWKQTCANQPEAIGMLDAINAAGAPLAAKQTGSVQVTGIGPAEVARTLIELQAANAKISDPRAKIIQAKEVHALFAKEIRGNKAFDDMPLNAATSADNVGTLAGTLVAQRTLELLKYEFPVLGQITSDYSDQPAQFNQTTRSRIITVPAVITYDATIDTATGRAKGWVIATQAVATDVDITIDNHKGVEISFDTNTLGSTVRRLFDEQAEGAQYALGKAIVDSLYAKILAASFATNTAFVEASVDFGRRTFSKVRRILTLQGVPNSGRYALIHPPYFEKLEQDPTLVSLAVYQKPEIITGSQLPEIGRFLPIEAPNLPSTGNMAAFFGHKSSLLIQTRIPNDYTTVLGPASSYGQVMVVTNPDTGISVLLVQYVSHQGGYAAWRIAAMWGTAVGNEKTGQIVKSA